MLLLIPPSIGKRVSQSFGANSVQTSLGETSTACKKCRAAWFDAKIIAYCRDKGLCLCCGNQGHAQKDCQFVPAQHLVKVTRAESGFDKNLALSERTDVDEDSKSGKEQPL